MDNSTSPLQTVAKYALPNGCFTLAFIAGNGILLEQPHRKNILKSSSYLVGELTTKVRVTVLPYSKAFMVQLNPWAATLLSGVSFSQLKDNFAQLKDLNNELACSLSIDLGGNQCFKTAVEKKLENYLRPTNNSALIAACFNQFVNQSRGNPLKFADLSSLTGYSMRSLEKKFKQHVGLTPKRSYTILRVRTVVDELTLPRKDVISLTSLAYKHGFADQAHFIRTYATVMGSSPSKFDKEEYILPFCT